ncbi:MAG: hypothetical protein U1F43_00980 [Myxococcota bacterium]
MLGRLTTSLVALGFTALGACPDDKTSGGDGLGGDATGAGDGADADTAADDSASDALADASDLGFVYPCEAGAIEACVTACQSSGVRQCFKDWGPCVPLAEQCGNCKDDDCNGVVDDSCPDVASCTPPTIVCPTAVISVSPSTSVDVGTTVTLSAAGSLAATGTTIARWAWSVEAPAGSSSTFVTAADIAQPTFVIDLAGQYVFSLRVWDALGTESCTAAVRAVQGNPFPPATPEVGCADGAREGFVDEAAWPQIAACSGAWTKPGTTPDSVVPTCDRKGGDDGPNPDGGTCSSADLCAVGWHVCNGWRDLAARSPTGCAGAVPPGAAPKSYFFAIRQPSATNIVCGDPGAGDNDVFGCGNLGVGLGPDRGCGPLDRALASTQPDHCGFNEAEPNLGPWQCIGGAGSDLHEGATVTKKGCPNHACSYDGQPVGSSDRGGVVCCRDVP